MSGDSALTRILAAALERHPEPPRHVSYATVAVVTLRSLPMLVLLLGGVGWTAALAAIAMSGPPEYRVPAGASMLLGLGAAAVPLLAAWNFARTIRSGVVIHAVVESVTHSVPDVVLNAPPIRNVIAHGSWRLPGGQVESFQTTEVWAADLRPGSVVDLLDGPGSVLMMGPHRGEPRVSSSNPETENA